MRNDRPNIIFITVDQLRQDFCSLHPSPQLLTPNLARLQDGLTLGRCVTVNPVCQPARAAMLTGRYSRQLGLLCQSGDLDWSLPNMLRALRHSGYTTYGCGKCHFLQNWPWTSGPDEGHDLVALQPRFLELGFDALWQVSGKTQALRNRCHYTEYLRSQGLLEDYREDILRRGKYHNWIAKESIDTSPFRLPAEHYADRVIMRHAIQQLEKRQTGRPFFSWISLCGPHPPFDPPAERLSELDTSRFQEPVGLDLSRAQRDAFEKRRLAYAAMIIEIDTLLGKLFDWLQAAGLWNRTAIIFTSDHGEMLGDHGRSQKSVHHWPSTRVPTVIRHPSFLLGQTSECLAENIDLTATILEMADLDPQTALSEPWPALRNIIPARSLLPVLRGDAQTMREYAFSECYNLWQMVESPDAKFVRFLDQEDPDAPREAFYDLRSDPHEQRNLIDAPALQEQIAWHRRRRDHLLDHMPPAQRGWAPYRGHQHDSRLASLTRKPSSRNLAPQSP